MIERNIIETTIQLYKKKIPLEIIQIIIFKANFVEEIQCEDREFILCSVCNKLIHKIYEDELELLGWCTLCNGYLCYHCDNMFYDFYKENSDPNSWITSYPSYYHTHLFHIFGEYETPQTCT